MNLSSWLYNKDFEVRNDTIVKTKHWIEQNRADISLTEAGMTK